MRFYYRSFECPNCRTKQVEVTREPEMEITCCGETLTAKENHHRSEPLMNIHPVHVAKGRTFPYYDECLDKVVKSPSHKKNLLKEMGLTQIESATKRKY